MTRFHGGDCHDIVRVGKRTDRAFRGAMEAVHCVVPCTGFAGRKTSFSAREIIMTNRLKTCGRTIAFSLGLFAGCAQPKGQLDGKGGPPPRPAELDKLSAFAGTWAGTADITMYTSKGPRTSKFTGTEHVDWAVNQRFMVSNFTWSMGDDSAQKHEGVSYMTWDPKEKEFHSWEFMGDGTVNRGEFKYDEKRGIWKMEGKGTDPMAGRPSRSEGTIKFVDGGKTMAWQFTMWDPMKLSKKMEGKGISKKQ